MSDLKMQLLTDNIPNHVALIMDGNGRWAKKRFMPVSFGHSKGADRVEDCVEFAKNIGIKHLSFYAFSTENWKRDKKEVDHIIGLFFKFYEKKFKKIIENEVRFKICGSRVGVSKELLDLFDKMEEETKHFDTVIVNFCFNYGGRAEIVETVNYLKDNDIDITEENITNNLYTSASGDVDLLIRTSGEERLSNFLIWQNSYSEFVFVEELWPDFKDKIFLRAINEYQSRDRRYGGRK